jgi:hypothetical protein
MAFQRSAERYRLANTLLPRFYGMQRPRKINR